MRYSRYFPVAMLALMLVAALTPQTALAFQLFPGENPAGDFRDYVIAFYNFSISAGILIATVLIMIGGMIWVTSAGNSSRVELAKSYIIDSIIGVILLLGAVVILRLINPALVELPVLAPANLSSYVAACVYKTTPEPGYDRCLSADKLYCETVKGTLSEGKTCEEVCPLIQPADVNKPGACGSPAKAPVRPSVQEQNRCLEASPQISFGASTPYNEKQRECQFQCDGKGCNGRIVSSQFGEGCQCVPK